MSTVEKQTVLIIDDSILICQQIKNILSGEDIYLEEAHSAVEAMAAMEQCRPDLVLLDVVLPDAEGYDLCRQLQEKDQNNASIIFITSKDSDEDVVRGFSLGACDYIKKPFGNEELKSRVIAHLSMKKQKDELDRMNRELKSNMEKLNYMAFRDGLTGLYNRRYVQDDLMEEMRGHDRRDVGSVLIMADVDDFKIVNDRYGHEAGDVALICVSNIMESICRRHRVIRWGGEEFLIVLFSVTNDEAYEISERIRREVEAFPFVHGDDTFRCTVTLGLSVYDNEDDMKHNIQRADKALYVGKRTGKNRSVWYGEARKTEL